jgi:hypothetical protein
MLLGKLNVHGGGRQMKMNLETWIVILPSVVAARCGALVKVREYVKL